MPLLDPKYLDFDKADVHLMQQMMVKFDQLHEHVGMPSLDYSSYVSVFAIALLAAQQETEKISKRLEWLTRILVVLTIVLVVLTVILVFLTAWLISPH